MAVQLWSTQPPSAVSVDPFGKAAALASTAESFVQKQIDYIRGNLLGESDYKSLAFAYGKIDALGQFKPSIPENLRHYDIRKYMDTQLILNMDISDIDKNTFGSISAYNPASPPSSGTLPTIDEPTIPTFTPSVTGISVPSPPGWSVITQPGTVPGNPGFSYPDAVDITLPDAPNLFPVNLPASPTIVLPSLDLAEFPELKELSIDTLIDWSEPTYSPEIWADVKNQILTFLAGGTGIRPDVEEAIVNRGRDREDRIVRQQIQEAVDEWANRGYTAPPGMLAKRIDTLRTDGTLKKLGLQREVVIKAMDAELENLRFAVQQGIAAEQLFINIYLAAVDRLFQVQRFHIEWQIQAYNITVQAFQAKLQENSIRAQVYEVQVRAALAEIEVFKALIQAEQVKAEVNKSLVDAYRAEIEARKAMVDIYVAQVQAVKVQAEVFATEVQAYRGEVEAYASRVSAEKTKFDAYESQVRGEVAKASIVEAEARAYQAQIGGIETGVRAQVATLEGAVSKFRAQIEAYDANLRHWAGLNQNELAQIQANVEGHRLDVQRFVAESGVEIEANKLEAALWEAENRLGIEAYRAEIARMEVIMEKAIQESSLLLEAIKASGQLASTISAGALAALHVGATTSGSGSVSATGNQGFTQSQSQDMSYSCSTGQTTNISYTQPTEAGMPGFFCGLDDDPNT